MPSSDNPKRTLLRRFATVAKAVAHEHRLELLEAIAQGERNVEALARQIGQSLANTSHHLQQLRRGGLIVPRREGKLIYYRLAGDDVIDLLGALTRIGERNIAEISDTVRSYFRDRDSLEPVTREDLLARTKEGLVTVLDVRPEDEFAHGHLPGAVNVPLEALESRLNSLDPSCEIVAYCRGAYCVLSFEAVSRLRARGFKVRRLEDGFPEWKAAGLPVEMGLSQG